MTTASEQSGSACGFPHCEAVRQARLMLDALDGFGVVQHHPMEIVLVERMSSGRPR